MKLDLLVEFLDSRFYESLAVSKCEKISIQRLVLRAGNDLKLRELNGIHLGSEQKKWVVLGYIDDYTTHLYREYKDRP